MLRNSPIRGCEFKLKKFIQNSIHHQSLINCQLLMTKPKLNLFYRQLQTHLVAQNLNKQNQQRGFSVQTQPLIKLNAQKPTTIVQQPQWIKRRTVKKSRENVGKSKKQQADDWLEPHRQMIKEEIKSDKNYFVRMIKNPKSIRYIRSQPWKYDMSNSTNLNQYRRKPKLMNTNFEQRKKILKDFKKSSHMRDSIMV